MSRQAVVSKGKRKEIDYKLLDSMLENIKTGVGNQRNN